jgi:hypothetical protein
MSWEFECPKGWEVLQPWGGGYALHEIGGGLKVIIDCETKSDGNEWIHVSYSRRTYTPTHDDTIKVRLAFLGDRYAYAVLPPPEHYVNIHSHCLHLWARLDGKPALPEFSEILPHIGRSI